MTCDAEQVASAIDSLLQRLSQEQAAGHQLSEKEQLVLRLNQQYANDVGVLSAFFLNLVRRRAVHTSSSWQLGGCRGLADQQEVAQPLFAAGATKEWLCTTCTCRVSV